MAAPPQLVAVHAWPQGLQLALDQLRSDLALTIISVPTPATTDRSLARQLIRTAVRETLAAFLARSAASIVLSSLPGQAIEVADPLACLQVSLSHMPGMSVAAISRNATIGVDLMQVDQSDAGMDDLLRVARDYLGPAAAARLQRAVPALRPAVFAQEWTRFEARLKCLGLGLAEWSPALDQQLANCRVMALVLPENCRGMVAASPSQLAAHDAAASRT